MSIALYGIFLAASPLHAQPVAEGGRVILLGARWCAPCMAEWRDLASLVVVAKPDQVVLAWVDRPISPPASLNGKVAVMPLAQARELALRLGGEGFGLPMTAYTPAGMQACPPWRAPLHPRDLESLRKLCNR